MENSSRMYRALMQHLREVGGWKLLALHSEGETAFSQTAKRVGKLSLFTLSAIEKFILHRARGESLKRFCCSGDA
jgi:hypothetical protein